MLRRWPLVLLVILLLAGCAQEKGKTEGVPIYSGSKVYSVPSFYYQLLGIPAEGVKLSVYYTEEADPQKVLGWYKEKLSDYTIVEDIALAEISSPSGTFKWGAVVFQKGNLAVGIWAMRGASIEGGKGTVYFIVEGPAAVLGSVEGKAKETLPPYDQVSGEEPLPRYPGAVMIEHVKEKGYPYLGSSIRASYGTLDAVEKVVEWYSNYLTANGWSLESESRQPNEAHLYYKKGSERVYLEIYGKTETRDYTMIEIHHSPNKLPPSDTAKGEEPIARYPRSVMLEYASLKMGDKIGYITITYATEDSPQKVFDWYVNEMQNSGWQIVQQGSTGKTLSLVAVKKQASIQIEITQYEYTEIRVMFTGS